MPENKDNPFSDYLDALYYSVKEEFGSPPLPHTFDPKVLFPIQWHIEQAKAEYKLEIFEKEIIKYIEKGLIPRFIQSDGTLGFPIYITGRINFIKKMEQELNLSLKEIQEIIKEEDGWINNILTVDGFEYKDIPLFEVFKEHIEGEISHIKTIFKINDNNKVWDEEKLEIELKELKELQSFLNNIKFEQLSEQAKDFIKRSAFKILYANELTRLHKINGFRTKIIKGYSPYVEFNDVFYKPYEYDVELKEINWKWTIFESESNGTTEIKTPEFTIKNGEIKLSNLPSPSRFEAIFDKYNLREYLEVKCNVKICPACGKEHRRKGIYCSEVCRNRAKSKRYRKKHPLAKKLSNLKYMIEAAKDEALLEVCNNLENEIKTKKERG